MSVPFVTVVMPALNAVHWVPASLASVAEQTFPKDRLEVIVVDDGSSDGTAEKASGILATSGIAHTVIRNIGSQGPSAARNAGWRRARGEWIQFLDADDLLDPLKIETQMRIAPSATSDVAVVYSPWGRLVADGEKWQPQTPHVEPTIGADPLADVLRPDNFMQLGSLLFSRAWLMKTGGFVESYRLIEDVDLLMRIVMGGGALRPAPAGRSLSWYRQRDDSLSRESRARFTDACLRNARLAEKYWADRHELVGLRVRVLVEIYYMGARYYAEHDPEAFRSVVQDIYRVEPTFLPSGPASLRVLTRLLGYPRAERCSVRYRSLKRALSS